MPRALDVPYVVSRHELAYLAFEFEGPGSALCRRRLVSEGGDPSPGILLAGAATMSLRGMLVIEGDQVRPIDEAAALAYVLGSARRWVDVALVSDGLLESHSFVDTGTDVVTLSTVELGNARVALVSTEVSLGRLVGRVVEGLFAEGRQGSASVVVWREEGRLALNVVLSEGLWSAVFADDEGQGQTASERGSQAHPGALAECLIDHRARVDDATPACQGWACAVSGDALVQGT